MTRRITKAQLARELGISRAFLSMVSKGKRKLSQKLVNKLNRLNVNISCLNMNGVQVVGGSNPLTPTISYFPVPRPSHKSHRLIAVISSGE